MGFTGASLGRLVQGEDGLVPCTALAVREIVKRALLSDQTSWRGKKAVVVGRSHNVGLPIQILLGSDSAKGGLDMTVTLCHLGRNLVVGDVHRDARQVASLVTPVPGGVGPCTVACLMANTLRAAASSPL